MSSPKVAEYRERSGRYWKQVEEHWRKGEREKATEAAWGAVVEAIKALASSQGIKLRTHKEIVDYIRKLANSLGDRELYNLFKEAEAGHANFYEGFMDEARVKEVLAAMRRLWQKVGEWLPPLPADPIAKEEQWGRSRSRKEGK